MDIDFSAAEVSFLRQCKGFRDLKVKAANDAQQLALEADGLFQEYLKALTRIHQVDGENLILRPDLTGFSLDDRHVGGKFPDPGGTTTPPDAWTSLLGHPGEKLRGV